MCHDDQSTGEWLALHYHNVSPDVLRELDREISESKKRNGGNANIFLILRNGAIELMEATYRTAFRKPPKK